MEDRILELELQVALLSDAVRFLIKEAGVRGAVYKSIPFSNLALAEQVADGELDEEGDPIPPQKPKPKPQVL